MKPTYLLLKDNKDIFSPFLLNHFNNIIDSLSSINYLKLANITPFGKKESQNYRQVGVLSNISKNSENILNQNIYAHFENIFSKQQTDFCQGFNVQYCLLVTLAKFRKSLDKDGDYAALLTDLPKAFDWIPHDIINSKLHAYNFNVPLLKLMNIYLTNGHQRVTVYYTK